LTLVVGPMRAEDWEPVRAIYLEGIATGNATFEVEAPSWEQWDAGHLPECRLVARVHGLNPVAAAEGTPPERAIASPVYGGSSGVAGGFQPPEPGCVAGWVALSRVSSRCVYAGVAEVSVYVAERARGQGIGRALVEALIAESEQFGLWTLQAGVFPENAGSLALLQRCGFRVVGTRERLGQRDGRWRDVVLLERRSPVVGRD
jgi:L-amino acid N-acyltransferase YncA